MRPMILVLVLSTFAFFFQGALAGSSYASSRSQSSSESRSVSSSSGSSSSGSSDSASERASPGSSDSASERASPGSSDSASERASAGSGPSGSGKPAPPPAPKEVGIKCIGYLDMNAKGKHGHVAMKYKAYDQFCPGDKYCATLSVKGADDTGSGKVDYSGCPHLDDKTPLCTKGPTSGSVSMTIEGSYVEGEGHCCEGDYCNRNSNLAAVKGVDPKTLKKEKEMIQTNSGIVFIALSALLSAVLHML